MTRTRAALAIIAIAVGLVVPKGAASAGGGDGLPTLDLRPHMRFSTTSRVSAPLRRLARRQPASSVRVPSRAGAVRLVTGAPRGPEQAPSSANFDGIANDTGVAPPDPNGDVGPNDYVQIVNGRDGAVVAVFDKTGGLKTGPLDMSSIWSGTGNECETDGEGDPIAQYDQLADRWILSQFAFRVNRQEPQPPFVQCVAVSTSPDPSGTYTAYSFVISDQYFGDYPKFGVWPDGYYMSVHLVDPDNDRYVAQGIIAFDRETMLVGGEPRAMVFFANPGVFGLLPSDAQGATPPPVGSPNYLVTVRDGAISGGEDRLDLYRFHVDWNVPDNSTITGPVRLPTDPFDSNLCNGAQNCIRQQGTSQKLDPVAVSNLGDLMMYPLVYRNFGNFEALAFNHTVDANHHDLAAPRWYEVANPAKKPFIAQQGTYAPDSTNRWMGSVSMDRSGGIALGFSMSDAFTFPAIGYTGRLASDAPGTMRGTNLLVAGGGAQTGTNRWGDYSAMQVDPIDECTFWYTQEYYSESSAIQWRTRVANFTLDSCGGPAPSPTPPPPDTQPPRITRISDKPDPFRPGTGGKQSRVKIKWTVSESSDDKVQILNRRGHVVRRFAGSVDAGTYYVLWKGTTDRGHKAPSGKYTYKISAVDSSGNKGTATGKTTLKRAR